MSASPYVPQYAAPAVPRAARFPGIASVEDGASAVAWVESHISQGACGAPGVPGDAIRNAFMAAVKARPRNLWEESVEFLGTETSLATASACEGFALAGGRIAGFVCGQGLVQVKEAMHVIAGKRLPVVFHTGARALSSQGRTRQPGHDDVMSVADCGWGILFARNAQQAADLALIARRAAEYSETPFLCAQDGFLTTHTLQSLRLPEPDLMREYAGAPAERLRAAFNPWRPMMSGASQADDSYMKARVAQRFFLDRVQPALESAMQEFTQRTGRRYGMLEPYRMDDAQYAFVGLGSMMGTAFATVDYLREQGVRAGVLAITSFRPFPAVELARALANCRAVTVFERADTPLAGSNPLTLEVKAALADAVLGRSGTPYEWIPEAHSAIVGVGGADVRPGHFIAAAENMRRSGPRFFVLGVKHPDALRPAEDPALEDTYVIRVETPGAPDRAEAMRRLAMAAAAALDSSLEACENIEAERRGLPAGFELRLSSVPIRSRTHGSNLDVIVGTGDTVDGLKRGGALCLTAARAWSTLPAGVRRKIREQNITVWILEGPPLAAVLRLSPWPFDKGALFATLAGRMEEQEVDAVRQAYEGMAQMGIPPAELAMEIDEAQPPVELALAEGGLAPADFRERVTTAYRSGSADRLEADAYAARGLVPASTTLGRSFRHLAEEFPKFAPAACVGCMECVNQCPDTAIMARVVEPAELERRLAAVSRADYREELRLSFAVAKKFEGGLFGLFIDLDKCKGCGECVTACGHYKALTMAPKTDLDLSAYDRALEFNRTLPETPERFLNEKSLGDIMLTSRAQLYTGGADNCTGCGESTALRMLMAATGFVYGADHVGVVAAMDCDFCSLYPYNPFAVPWTSSLVENAPADAMGIRLKWNQQGHSGRRLWVVGGDDALVDTGFQQLSRLLASGMDIKILVLDTHAGEPSHRDIAAIAMMHHDVFVAQTTTAHVNHFYKAVMAANANPGPAVVTCYASCIKEHELPADRAVAQAKLAVESRVFPLLVYDPSKGESFRQRLSLKGNPALELDWYQRPRTKQPVDPMAWARTEPRFSGNFDQEGLPGEPLARMQQERLANWRRLQELAGLR